MGIFAKIGNPDRARKSIERSKKCAVNENRQNFPEPSNYAAVLTGAFLNRTGTSGTDMHGVARAHRALPFSQESQDRAESPGPTTSRAPGQTGQFKGAGALPRFKWLQNGLNRLRMALNRCFRVNREPILKHIVSFGGTERTS